MIHQYEALLFQCCRDMTSHPSVHASEMILTKRMLERIQIRATQMIQCLETWPDSKRFNKFKSKKRRQRSDLIGA